MSADGDDTIHVFGVTDVARAREPKHLPVVMTRDEMKAALGQLDGDKWLMAGLM